MNDTTGIYLARRIDGSYWLECWAGTRNDMPAVVEILPIDGSVSWDDLLILVSEHQAKHFCSPEVGP